MKEKKVEYLKNNISNKIKHFNLFIILDIFTKKKIEFSYNI